MRKISMGRPWLLPMFLAAVFATGVASLDPTGTPTHNPTPAPTRKPSGSPTGTPKPTNTYRPSSSPTMLPSPQPTVTSAPTHVPTAAPTHKPTEFPTVPAGNSDSVREAIIQSIVLVVCVALIGLALGLGDMKQERDRRDKKMKKIMEYNLQKEEWRNAISANKEESEMEETIETFKEKYYPGDRVVVLVPYEKKPVEVVRATTPALLGATGLATGEGGETAAATGEDEAGGGKAQGEEEPSGEGGGPSEPVDDKETLLSDTENGAEGSEAKDGAEDKDGESSEKKEESGGDDEDGKKEEEEEEEEDEASLAGDLNGDGYLDPFELEKLAQGMNRGRSGVVVKFADAGNRVIVEFDEEEKDEETESESEEEEDDDAEFEFEFEEDLDEDKAYMGKCGTLLCLCCKVETKAQIRRKAHKRAIRSEARLQRKGRTVHVRIPQGAPAGTVLKFQVGKTRYADVAVPKGKKPGQVLVVKIPPKGKEKLKSKGGEEVLEEEQEPPKTPLKPLPPFSKRLGLTGLVAVSSPCDEEVRLKFPDRDWDEEELDEIAGQPSALFQILEMAFYPLRVLLYAVFCAVGRVKKIKSADVEPDEGDEQDLDGLAASKPEASVFGGDDSDDDDETMIEGFPIDCGTKDRKFLSMAKCVAVTTQRHPHREIVVRGGDNANQGDGDGTQQTMQQFISPYELWWDTGQHNLECGPSELNACKKKYGLIRPKGIMQNYGIGMSLYFKFVKTLNCVFFVAAVLAVLPCTYYWHTSAWSATQKGVYLNNPSTEQKYQFFYTTAGSLLGSSFACGQGLEDERFALECPVGKIIRVEAYYGDPYGSCQCPPEQVPLTSGVRAGQCPGRVDYSKNSDGECTEQYPGRFANTLGVDIGGTVKPCFKGQMWNGDVCCGYELNSASATPRFDELALMPDPSCNSASTQFIVQAHCLGHANCTLDVKANATHEWEVSNLAPCGEGFQHYDFSTNTHTCTVGLESKHSNFTGCPAHNERSKRRMVVRALCGEDSFTSNLFGEGQPQSRDKWGKAMSYIDACITALIFWAVLWMAEKEKAAVYINDMVCCSADDFTLRIKHLPPPRAGMSPDLEKLKRNLKHHFDDFCQTQPPVIFDRPVKVLDINFGLNNQDTIRNMKIRGALARVLDLEVEKLTLMNKYSIHSEKEVHKQDVKVRVLKVRFLKVCELVKFRKTRLEARTAFITFASEEGFERCRRAYGKSFFFGQPTSQMYRKRFKMRVEEVMRPSDYIWENLSTAPSVRFVKVSISNLLALAILVVGFACIIKAKGVESSALLALSSTDCTAFEFKYGGDPAWDPTALKNLNATSAEVTRLDVVRNLYPTYYNNSFPNAGLLGCFCLDVSTTHDLAEAEALEFRDPYSGQDDTLCQGFFEEYNDVQVMSTLAVAAVVVVNELLKTVFRALVAFEGHETLTEEILAHTVKLFGSMLMNTAFIVVLIAGNVNLFTGGARNAVTSGLAEASLLSGSLADFTSAWYLQVGTAIVITMWINVYVLNIAVVQDSVKIKLVRCLDRGCTLDATRTRQKLQVHLETLYTGPELLLEVRYSCLLVGFFVCMIFSSGMPILWVIGWASFLVAFCVDKWAFLRVYRVPPKYGATLARYATDLLPWAVLMHVVIAIWTFSSPQLFDFEGFTVEQGGNSSQFSFNGQQRTYADAVDYNANHDPEDPADKPFHGQRNPGGGGTALNKLDFWPPGEVVDFESGGLGLTLERALFHRNSFPHLVLLLVWVLWFVLFRLLDVDDVLACLLDVCKKKRTDQTQKGGDKEDLLLEKGSTPLSPQSERGWSETSSEAPPASEFGRFDRSPQLSEETALTSVSEGGEEDGEGLELGNLEDGDNTNGGAPAGEVSDDKEDRTGGGVGGGARPPPRKKKSASKMTPSSESEAPPPPAPPAPPAVGSGVNDDHDPVDHHHLDHGNSSQKNLKVDEAARVTYANMVGIGAAQDETPEQYEEKYQQFLKVWQSESGIASVEAFMPDDPTPDFDVSIESMSVDFRTRWLAVCQAIQREKEEIAGDNIDKIGGNSSSSSAGHADLALVAIPDDVSKIEGNPDLMWAIPTDVLVRQMHLKLLSEEMLGMYAKEVAFRKAHPELYTQVTRRLQGIPSFDYNANEEYIEAFALDSKSIHEYKRGNMQVTGEDYELAQKGFVNQIKRLLLGPQPLGVVFPDIVREVSPIVMRHTTQIGIDPTQIVGPRFVMNVRVPPTPKDLSPQDTTDPEYDEFNEKWQYLHIAVNGVFDYRLRLPRGLQHNHIPEFQIEIPAFQQVRSSVKTALIGGEVRSVFEQEELDVQPVKGRSYDEEAAVLREQRKLNNTSSLLADDEVESLGVLGSAREAEKVDERATAAHQKEKDEAARKIQGLVRGRSAKKKVSRMQSWQSRWLQALEGQGFLALAISLVVLDLVLQTSELRASTPSVVNGIGFFVTFFFLTELSLRFWCYAQVARGTGCDLGDLDFFSSDWFRLLDLVIVVVDLVALVVMLFLENAGSAGGVGLRFAKSGRILRVARLGRFARTLKALGFGSRGADANSRLTGKERIGMQRFHLSAPRDVDKGNRLEVSIPSLGKVNVEFPKYSALGAPVQFHLPVVCAHHLNRKISPNCSIVAPNPLNVLEREYRGTVAQQGWATLWSPLDDHGLGLPPPEKTMFGGTKKQFNKKVLAAEKGAAAGAAKKSGAGGDMDGDGVDDVDKSGIPLDARQQQLQRTAQGKDPVGYDLPGAKETMDEKYREHYRPDENRNYRNHRVWYQVMAFAPRTVVKDFQNLKLFEHELQPYKAAAVLTLKEGKGFGSERVAVKLKLSKGIAHGQTSFVHVAGVGDLECSLLCTNHVAMPGLHKVDCLTLGVLPWGEKPLNTLELVPESLSEVSFDYPALLLPKVAEVVGASKMTREEKKQAEETAREDELKEDDGESHHKRGLFGRSLSGSSMFSVGTHHKGGGDDGRVTTLKKAGVRVKFLNRDAFVKVFEVKSKSRLEIEKAAERRKKSRERAQKGFLGFGQSSAGKQAEQKRKRAELKAARFELKRQKMEKRLRHRAKYEEGFEYEEGDELVELERLRRVRNGEEEEVIKEEEGGGGGVGEEETKTGDGTAGEAVRNKEKKPDTTAPKKKAMVKKSLLPPPAHSTASSPAKSTTASSPPPALSPALKRGGDAFAAKSLQQALGGVANKVGDGSHVKAEDQAWVMEHMARLKFEDSSQEKIVLPKVGRFTVKWPAVGRTPQARAKAKMAEFKVEIPAIKPNLLLPTDLAALAAVPGPNALLSPEARRYQVGWVMVKIPKGSTGGVVGGSGVNVIPDDKPKAQKFVDPAALSTSTSAAVSTADAALKATEAASGGANEFDVFMRLPAYVTRVQRALAKLDPKDEASPWNAAAQERKDQLLQTGVISAGGASSVVNPLLSKAGASVAAGAGAAAKAVKGAAGGAVKGALAAASSSMGALEKLVEEGEEDKGEGEEEPSAAVPPPPPPLAAEVSAALNRGRETSKSDSAARSMSSSLSPTDSSSSSSSSSTTSSSYSTSSSSTTSLENGSKTPKKAKKLAGGSRSSRNSFDSYNTSKPKKSSKLSKSTPSTPRAASAAAASDAEPYAEVTRSLDRPPPRKNLVEDKTPLLEEVSVEGTGDDEAAAERTDDAAAAEDNQADVKKMGDSGLPDDL